MMGADAFSPRTGKAEGDKIVSQSAQVLRPSTGCAGILGLQLLPCRPRDVRRYPLECSGTVLTGAGDEKGPFKMSAAIEG